MLAALGEAPVSTIPDDLDEASADVAMAVVELRNAAREVQSEGWKFNTEFALAIASEDTPFAWEDPDGTTVSLSIFKVPAGLASWSLSKVPQQVGGVEMDVTQRPSKQYTEGEDEDEAPVLVIYDRVRNRDGFPVDEREFLWIDPVWLFDFTDLPETARRYLTIVAARRFIQNNLGSVDLAGFKQQDEGIARRNLVRDQGNRDAYALLNHPEVNRALGSRWRGPLGFGRLRNRP